MVLPFSRRISVVSAVIFLEFAYRVDRILRLPAVAGELVVRRLVRVRS